MDAPSDLGIEAPKQPKNCFFPFSKFGSKQRRFNVAWYADREWLEYSKAKDAAFCYCCRKFSSRSGCESDVFTIAGYKDWTSALESKKGFARHVGSMQHTNSMKNGKTHEIAMKTNSTISRQLVHDVVEENRYYVSTIMEVVFSPLTQTTLVTVFFPL